MPKKVLVVDDEKVLLDIVADALSNSNYTLFFAENGQQALAMLPEVSPDAILLDLNMPQMDGMEFLSAISYKQTDRVAIIAMTGERDYKQIKTCYERGITHFLHKPFNIYELHGAIENAISLKIYTTHLEQVVGQKTQSLQEKITELEHAQQQLAFQRDLEQFITGVSTTFVRVEAQDLLKTTANTLSAVAQKIGAESCALYWVENDSLQQHCAVGGGNAADFYHLILPWLKVKLRHSDRVFYPDITFIGPADANVNNTLSHAGVRSFMTVAMVSSKNLAGFIAFSTHTTPHPDWVSVIPTVQVIADLFVSLSERINYEKNLKELLEMKEHFIAAISHELRTPLAIINEGVALFTENLSDSSDEETLDLVQMVSGSVDRLNKIIHKVLDFRQLEKEKAVMQLELYNVNQLIDELRPLLRDELGAKDIALKFDLDESVERIYIDKNWIARALMNLFANAVKFTEHGYIRISTRSLKDWIGIAVEDTGRGIENRYLTQLFEQFALVGNMADRSTGGLGLGLAISRDIIRKHGGEIKVQSTPGRGSVFSFYLPRQIKPEDSET